MTLHSGQFELTRLFLVNSKFSTRKMILAATKFIFLAVILVPYVLCAHNVSLTNDDAVRIARELVNNFLNSTANGFAPGIISNKTKTLSA